MIDLFILHWLLGRTRRKQRQDYTPPTPKEAEVKSWVDCDGERILLSQSGLAYKSIAWSDLRAVSIRSEGRSESFGIPLLWCFADQQQEVRITEFAQGMDKLRARLADLPGFDSATADSAKNCREEQTFVLWRSNTGAPTQITHSPGKNGTRMIGSKEELFAAIAAESIPLNADAIWNGNVPSRAAFTCQNPALLFDAFLRHPEGFPRADEMLILWQTNGDSVTAYLREQRKYIRYYLEDGPAEYQVLGETYQQMMADIFARFFSAGTERKLLDEMALFFEFRYLEEVIAFVSQSEDWEENAHLHIRALE